VWQELVDVNKVYRRLSKLKELNPLYQSIVLPAAVLKLQIHQRISEVESVTTDAIITECEPLSCLTVVSDEVATDDPFDNDNEATYGEVQCKMAACFA